MTGPAEIAGVRHILNQGTAMSNEQSGRGDAPMNDALTTQLAEALRRCEQVIRDAEDEDPGQWNWAAINADEGDQARQALAAFNAQQAAPSEPAQGEREATEFCWLVELFDPSTDNSLGYYHTGFTDLAGESRSTKDPLKAQRYGSQEAASRAAFRLKFNKVGIWRAVQHGFMSQARAALASQPAARVALTWDQFVAACEAEYGEDFEPQVVSQATEEEKTQMLRVVRMVERAHGIAAPAAQGEQG